ncbi:MAG TPA: hypothetical protein VF634_10215, partial [Pyrinomonadaceae bacterium]
MVERQPTEEQDGGGGRVVYSRLPSEAGEPPPPVPPERAPVSLSSFVHEPLAPTLPTLLVAFVLLVILVFALGYWSMREVESVSQQVQELDQQLADRMQALLTLRSSLTQLDNEARERGARVAGGGIINPFDLKLRRTRGEAEKQIFLFEHLPQAQTERGQSFRRAAADYIESTKDAEQYSIEGFKKFRPIEDHVDAFIGEINQQQFELRNRRAALVGESARRIRTLTWIAVLVSALIAAATIWEVQRRFRQMRRSLEESRRERLFSSQMLEGMVSAVAAIDGRGALRSANAAFFQLFPNASVGASVHDAFAPPDALKMFAAATASRVEHVRYLGRWTLRAEEGAGGNGGGERTFEVYASPLEIDDGHGQIMTLVDVTKTVATET